MFLALAVVAVTFQQVTKFKGFGVELEKRVENLSEAMAHLEGKVRLHLHPTFRRWSSYEIDARGGVAEDVLASYGAFTIGAEANDGATRLELDPMNVPGGTGRFHEN